MLCEVRIILVVAAFEESAPFGIAVIDAEAELTLDAPRRDERKQPNAALC